MQQTPFYQYHTENNAKFVDFAGWQMPISYGSIINEHNQVRETGGIFDVSHMGRFKITKRGGRKLLERTLTRRVSDMQPGSCRYSLICNEHGGVLDDVLVYRFDEHWMLVVNASNREKILSHLQANIGDLIVDIEDQTFKTAMIALQGPAVIDLISKFSNEVPSLKRYSFCEKNMIFVKMFISRTGYTGEDGVEVILPANFAAKAVKLLLSQAPANVPITPAGLGARDTLRLEAGMPLYGHELDENVDPLSAGLGFAVSLDKDQQKNGEKFIGQDALKKIKADGLTKKLVGLKLEGRRTARQGMEVLVADQAVGAVTSGCVSPTLGYPIAMAYVGAEHAVVGGQVTVSLGAKSVDAEIVKLPFYKK